MGINYQSVQIGDVRAGQLERDSGGWCVPLAVHHDLVHAPEARSTL
jgi:hypothetical protein